MSQHSQFPHHDGFASFGLAEQPPDSPDPLNTIDGLGGHSDLAVQAFGHYTAMTTQGAGSHNTFGNLTGYGNNQGQQNFGLGGDIYRFIQNHDQTRLEPWNPVRAAGVSSWAPNYSLATFTEYRNSAQPPSETDTVGPRPGRVLSDSGYGSAARPSIGIPSYNGDDNPETQSLVQQYNQHGINLETISNATHDRPRRRKVRSQRGGSTRSNVTLRCPDCSDFYAKTNSELRKHRARHEKPYRCDVENCPKFKIGFSTNNDLERHKICVHKAYGADVSLYRCKIDTCKDKSKDWPRQDNFRQHLKRVHNFDAPSDLSQFLHNPNEPKGQSMVGASEHTPSEAGRHVNSDQVSLPNQVSQLSWPVLDQGQAIPTGPLDGFPVDLRIVQPVDLHQFSTRSVLDQSDYASVMSPTECQPQEQAPLDSGHLAVDMEPLLSGLIPPRFQQDDGSTPRGQPLGDHSCVTPNILDHTNMEICHMEQALEVQIPHKEVIHLDDDSPVGYQEQTFADHRQIEPEISMSPDSMVLDVDEPVQEGTPDNGSGLEDAEAENDATADFHNLSKLSEHLAAECTPDVSSSPELLMTPSPPASNKHTPEMLDPEDLEDPRDVEASALAALKSLMALKEKGALKDKEVLDRFFLELGYQKSEEIDVKEVKAPGTPYAQSEVGSHKCNDCTKTFSRACELKKHVKRHEKPYACTFNLCEKRFGSKNDWKRHENGQHYQLEIWRCDEVTGDGVNLACGKVYHRRESLKSHLEKDHQMTNSAFIDKKLAECRHGRNFETRFWCGFCAKTIEPQGCGGPAHSERFDHIDDHFMGRNDFEKADIATWKSLHAVDSVDFPASSQAAAPTVVDNITRKRGLEEATNTAVASSSSSSSAPSSRPSSVKTKKAKRKGVKAEIFWTCCNCDNCWNVDVTNQCLDSCNHTQCRNCSTWENEVVAEKKREREGRNDSSNDF